MSQILNQLFINATILISFIFFGNQVLRDKISDSITNRNKKIMIGLCSGILGCILMFYSIEVMPKIILDFRNIPVITVAIHAGFMPALLAVLIIGTFRVVYFGLSISSIAAFIVAIVAVCGFGIIARLKINRMLKWLLSAIFLCIVSSIAFISLMQNSPLLKYVLLSYWLGMGIVSLATYLITEYITKSNEIYIQMKNEAGKDYLTGLYNVRQFESQLSKCSHYAVQYNEDLSILLLDIDHFKKVNDQYGHSKGDKVLKEVGKILTSACRSIDIISRNGGEEFSVILQNCNLKKALEVAERIRQNVEEYNFELDLDNTIKVTISIGVSSYPKNPTNIDDLLIEADKALYKAKRAGRNRVEVWQQN